MTDETAKESGKIVCVYVFHLIESFEFNFVIRSKTQTNGKMIKKIRSNCSISVNNQKLKIWS